MCLSNQKAECYQLSPVKDISSFALSLCIAENGSGPVDGQAKISSNFGDLELPLIGNIKPAGSGYEVDLKLKSPKPPVQSVTIQVITDESFNAQLASYTITLTNGKSYTLNNAPANNCLQ